ncbi:MAG: hypothetical protein ACRDM0_07050 [Thermoleophilaceae bacterium]
MNDYTFTLRFLSPIEDLDDLSIRLYDRIDDASLSGPDTDGSFLLEFDRRANGLPRALTSAISELRKVLPEAQILRVEEDDLATMADIAKRAGRSAESVRLLVNGKRGPGRFPPAAGRLDARTRVWRWSDAAEWFDEALGEPLPDTGDSAFLQAFNDALELSRLSGKLGSQQRRAVAKVLPVELVVQ